MWDPRRDLYWLPDGTLRLFFTYIMSNPSMTLYTGITNNLPRRVWEHKNGIGSRFTRDYHCDQLVYFESYELVTQAIGREKQIKGLTRAKKIALVKRMNPAWTDLADSLTSS